MKKEGGQVKQGIEAKYKLNEFPESKFKEKMLNEFLKYDKKLIKIAIYEDKLKKNEQLTADMKALVEKKGEFLKHLESMTTALKIYYKSGNTDKEGEAPVREVPPPKETHDSKRELEEFGKTAARRIGMLMVAGTVLKHNERLSNSPFKATGTINTAQQAVLQKLWATIAKASQGQDTSLGAEADRAAAAISALLLKSSDVFEAGPEGRMRFAEIADLLDKVAETKPVADSRFKVGPKPKPAFAPAPVPAPVPVPTTAPIPAQTIPSVPVPVSVSVPVPAPIVEKKEAPKQETVSMPPAPVAQTAAKKETEKPVPSTAAPQDPKQPQAKEGWARADSEEEAAAQQQPSQGTATAQTTAAAPPKEEEEEDEDDGFTVVKDKKTMQGERRTEGRGRGRGRGPRRYRYREDEGRERGRGYRGDNRGRPARRGP